MKILSILAQTYIDIGRKILYISGAVILLFTSSFLIVYPVWYFSTKFPEKYTVLILFSIILFLIISLYTGVKKNYITLPALLRKISETVFLILSVFLASVSLMLFLNSSFIQGITVIFILFTGAGLYRVISNDKNA